MAPPPPPMASGPGGRGRRGAGGKSDEEVLIALMRLVRDGNPAAAAARERYQQTGDQETFLATARALLDAAAKAPEPAQPLLGGLVGNSGGALPTAALEALSIGGGSGSNGPPPSSAGAGLMIDVGSTITKPSPTLPPQAPTLPSGGLGPIGSPRGSSSFSSSGQQQPPQQQQLAPQPQQPQQASPSLGPGGASPQQHHHHQQFGLPPHLGGAMPPGVLPPRGPLPPFLQGGPPGGPGASPFPPPHMLPHMPPPHGFMGGPGPGGFLPPGGPWGPPPPPMVMQQPQPQQQGEGKQAGQQDGQRSPGLGSPQLQPSPLGQGQGGGGGGGAAQQQGSPQGSPQRQPQPQMFGAPGMGGPMPPPHLFGPPPPHFLPGGMPPMPPPGVLGWLPPMPPGAMPTGPLPPPQQQQQSENQGAGEGGEKGVGSPVLGQAAAPPQPPLQGSPQQQGAGQAQGQMQGPPLFLPPIPPPGMPPQLYHQLLMQQQHFLMQQQQQQQQQRSQQQPPPQQQQSSSPLLAGLNGDATKGAAATGSASPLLQYQAMMAQSLAAAAADTGGVSREVAPAHEREREREGTDGGVAAGAAPGGADAGAVGATDGKVAANSSNSNKAKRTAKHQEGRLRVVDSFSRQPVGVVRPKADVTVQWEAPWAPLQAMQKPEVALFRLGVASNQNAVIAKGMSLPFNLHQHNPPPDPRQPIRGQITFYAPRSAGVFVFRMFDAADPVATHATSRRFKVDVQGRDVESNLRLILGQLKERRTLVAGLSQLHLLLRDLRPFQFRKPFPPLLWSVLTEAVQQGLGSEEVSVADRDEKGRSKYPVQSGVALILQAALTNPFVARACLDARQRAALRAAEGLWCPFSEMFFASEEERRQHYLDTLGLLPPMQPLPAGAVPPQVCLGLGRAMEAVLPSLLPSEGFLAKREDVRARVEAMLPAVMAVPPKEEEELEEKEKEDGEPPKAAAAPLLEGPIFPAGTRLRVFGSSANNFGNDAADLDMCVAFPPGCPPPAASAAEMIEALAAHLEAAGMAEVTPRPTARIPIVLFVDPATGLDCDISVENPLALRNTALLHAYSLADPRVRPLAYVVKHWARRRKINNASEGTLSSYAYILMVLHFLQSRRPSPVVPNLQQLPPTWDGSYSGIDGDAGNPHPVPPPPGSLPSVRVAHPIEKVDVETYFYAPPPTAEGMAALRAFGSRNGSSVGALLVEFFAYYTWEFDYREQVLSVRTGATLRKEEKAEDDCWPVNARLAVEDPFEAWYNVTHFLRESKHRHIRLEFLRAYALCAEAAGKVAAGQVDLSGPQQIEAAARELLEAICEEAPDPPARKNTMEDEEAMLAALAAGAGAGAGAGEGGGKEGEGDEEPGPEEVEVAA